LSKYCSRSVQGWEESHSTVPYLPRNPQWPAPQPTSLCDPLDGDSIQAWTRADSLMQGPGQTACVLSGPGGKAYIAGPALTLARVRASSCSWPALPQGPGSRLWPGPVRSWGCPLACWRARSAMLHQGMTVRCLMVSQGHQLRPMPLPTAGVCRFTNADARLYSYRWSSISFW